MGSLWFTNPPSFICDDFGQPGTVKYCALFHETGHGFTLNTPADYYYGGQIDGAATAELLNHYETYGIPEDLAFEIYQNGKRDFAFMTEQYGSYLSGGKRFTSWNDYNSERYDRRNNSPEADTFRSTLFVSALSYAFEKDLREEFLALNFPISEETIDELIRMVEE